MHISETSCRTMSCIERLHLSQDNGSYALQGTGWWLVPAALMGGAVWALLFAGLAALILA